MTNFFDALDLLDPVTPQKLEYRLYYDKDNKPLFYTMDDEDGDYILVSKEEFAECRYDVVVKDNKIHKVSGISIGKLVPSTIGYGTLRKDISIVGTEQYWGLKTYEND